MQTDKNPLYKEEAIPLITIEPDSKSTPFCL